MKIIVSVVFLKGAESIQNMDILLNAHTHNIGGATEVCVADSKYGTIENYFSCHDRVVRSYFGSLKLGQRGPGRQSRILPKGSFTYDETMRSSSDT